MEPGRIPNPFRLINDWAVSGMRYMPALVLQILLGILSGHAGEKPGMPDGLSHYPQTKAIVSFLSIHTTTVSCTNLLVISQFYRNDCIDCNVLEYFVTGDGQVTTHRRDADESLNSPLHKHLSDFDLKALHFALLALPSKNSYPPMGCLVVLSHKMGTNWVTHSYTRSSNLEAEPKALRKIFEIVGERPEANRNGTAR